MLTSFVRKHPYIIAFILLILYVCIVFYPLISNITTHIMTDDVFLHHIDPFFKNQSDIYNFFWSFWWVNHAVSVGESILYSHWIFPPTGADLVFHTMTIPSSLLMYPFVKIFGTIASFNIMILGLLVFGAFSYFVFLRKTFVVSYFSALLTSILFGFSPYFVYKAHVHLNLIGHAFWGSALAVFFFVYYKKRFTPFTSLLFALFAWITFWFSFVEFFMLFSVCGFMFVIFEFHDRFWRDLKSFFRRILFFVPTLLGSVSFLIFRNSGIESASIPLHAPLTLHDVLAFPRISILSLFDRADVLEFWGIYYPISAFIFVIIGFFAIYKQKRFRLLAFLFFLTVITFLLSIDLNQWYSYLVRSFSFGSGFRVFERFWPFLFFFSFIFVAFGIDFFAKKFQWNWKYVVISLFLIIIGFLEFYPLLIKTVSIGTHLDPAVSDSIDREKYLFVFGDPSFEEEKYVKKMGPNCKKRGYDIYAVNFDMKAVRLSFLARFDALQDVREMQYPYVYSRLPYDPEKLMEEFIELNVGYIIFVDKNDERRGDFEGKTLQEWDREALIELSR